MPIPAPAGPPIPYWPNVVVKPDTIRGVQTYFVNLILDIIFGAFAILIGVSSLLITTSDPASALAAAAIIGSASCGLVIVFVINFIVSLMSVIRMHHGADEYGPEHAVNARRGVLFKWIGTTLSTLAAILVVYLLIASTSIVFLGGTVPAIVYVPLLVTIFWTAGVAAKGQMYRFMVRSLQPPDTRSWSDIASFLIPSLGAIGIVVVGYLTVRVLDVVTNPSSVTAAEASRLFTLMIGGVFLPPGFALVGYLVFLMTYARTKNRLSDGLMRLYAAVPQPPAWGFSAPQPAVAATNPNPSPPAVVPNIPCPRCGFTSPSAATFCANCGNPLRPS